MRSGRPEVEMGPVGQGLYLFPEFSGIVEIFRDRFEVIVLVWIVRLFLRADQSAGELVDLALAQEVFLSPIKLDSSSVNHGLTSLRNTAVQEYFVRMRSSNSDLLRSFGFGLVGVLIHCVRFKESHNSLMQSEAEENQSQFRSMRMN